MSANPSGWRPTSPEAGEGVSPTATGNRALMLEEALIFEIGSTDTTGVDIVPAPKAASRLGGLARDAAIGLPGLASMEVSGFVAQDGGVNFGGSTLEGDVKMTFALTGEGSDKDEDGKMDRLGGKWTLVIDQPDYPRITITGNVQADAL